MASSSDLKWQPLELLRARFRENVSALSRTDPELADKLEFLRFGTSAPFFIAAQGDEMILGRRGTAGIEVIPNPLPPAAARNLTSTLFPSGNVTWPVVAGGLAYGWLWDRIGKLPCKVDSAPGYRPPVYFLTGHLDRLWAVMHVMDWQRMLADRRFHFIVGSDAVAQLRGRLIDDPTLPRPKVAIRIEQNLWHEDFDAMLKSVEAQTSSKTKNLIARLQAAYPSISPDAWSHKLRHGKLRVLGITSLYTTFIQHSMRDWLAAFERLGHETHLLIEPADHVILGQYGFARGVLDYRPDLLVMIDHYRASLGSVPESLPSAMWVQDRLPHIYSAAGGQNQKENDYCLGFGRLHLSSRYGYPVERFMSCPVGINEERLARCEPGAADQRRFACDVSYVSHASAPADQIMREYASRSGSLKVARLCDDMYQRLEAWYGGGGEALCDIQMGEMLDQSLRTTGVELTASGRPEFLLFLSQRVNNAMFRHQTLNWLAEMDIDLHLWGRGWESHPTLKRFARGEANNQTELPLIYRASKINLQVTPHGAVHQRLLDGLAAGGFFLLRWHPGDAVGRIYRELFDWCRQHNVRRDADLHSRADQRIRGMIQTINRLEGSTPENRVLSVFDVMNGHADSDFMTAADSIWDEYEHVAFNTASELAARLQRFLTDDTARHKIASAMREAVVERSSYASITKRLLGMIHYSAAARREKCAA